MSYTFSRALVEAFSPASCSEIDAFVPSSMSPTPEPFSLPDRTTEHFRLSRFGMTCAPLTEGRGEALLRSFLAVSRARTSAPQEMATESTASAPVSGAKWPESSVRYDPASSEWKTAHCLWEEVLPWSSVILPTWGMTRSGSVYRHPTAERPISGTGAGLWPTPNARDYKGAPGAGCVERGGRQSSLPQAVKTRTWPTATATAHKGWSPNHNRAMTDDRLDYSVERESFRPGQQTPPMRLNPEWVEWLMNWPVGMTSLEKMDDAIYRAWWESSQAYLQSGGMREMWFNRDPAEAPQRQEQGEQRAAEHRNSLPAMPRERTHQGRRLGQGASQGSAMQDLRQHVSAETQQESNDLQPGVQEGVGPNQCNEALGYIQRVTEGMKHRAHRIKALGNGQVSRVAATAFAALSGS